MNGANTIRKKIPRNIPCCVKTCASKSSKDKNLIFHPFPIDEQCLVDVEDQSERITVFEAWKRAAKVEVVNENLRICSRHFKKEDYNLPDYDSKPSDLKITAIPTLYLTEENNEAPRKRKRTTASNKRLTNKKAKGKNEDTSNCEQSVPEGVFLLAESIAEVQKDFSTTSDDIGMQVETIQVKQEKEDDSDCEIIGSTPGLVDVPDYIDPSSLSNLINEPSESLPPVVENIVSKLSNDEEFDKECDKFYKANLEMDVAIVQVDVAKVLAPPPVEAPVKKKINLSAGIDDIRTKEDLPGICTLCEQADDHIELLLKHFKESHHLKQGLYVCPFCDYTSSKYEVVMKHTTKVHKLSSQILKCDQCTFSTFRGDLYNRHTKEKIFSCDYCDFKTANLTNLNKHVEVKHSQNTMQKCRFCDFKSTVADVVKKHENSKHINERIHSCDKCPYETTLLTALKRHQERHNKSRTKKPSKAYTYVCVHCNFKTEDLNALEDHTLMNHPKKEILFCKMCDYSTTESAELTEHARKHLKSEPVD